MIKRNVAFGAQDKIEHAGYDMEDVSSHVRRDIECERQDECLRLKIKPEMDEKSFVRAAWICLAKMDAPFDVFDCNLDCIETMVHQVMVDTVTMKVWYEAVFSKIESGSRIKSVCDVSSTACVENEKARSEAIISEDDFFGLGEDEACEVVVSFDESAFLRCLENTSVESVVDADSYEGERMEETADCMREVEKKHNKDISEAVKNCFEDEERHIVEYNTELLERNARMFMAPEYYATINYKGKIYTLQAFRFGNAKVSCNEIENDHGLKAYEYKKHEELKTDKKKILESCSEEKKEWNRTPFVLSVISFALFVVGSVALSLIYLFNGAFFEWNGYSIGMLVGAIGAIVLFIWAVISFVLNFVWKTRRDRTIDAKAQEHIEAKEKAADYAIENFAARYKTRQLEILNEKFASLGIALASIEELS